MTMVLRLTIAVCTTVLGTAVAFSAFALSLDEAKAKGLVGERPNGYLGAVNPIAKRNRTDLRSVETLAGEKAIQNTTPGNFVEGPGGWVKK